MERPDFLPAGIGFEVDEDDFVDGETGFRAGWGWWCGSRGRGGRDSTLR